jgi:hypothetical protein
MHENFECDRPIMEKMGLEEIHGVTYAHAIGNREKDLGSYIVEYTISPVGIGDRKWGKTRACREMSKQAGEAIRKTKKNALRDELVILPGAAMSAADVVRALRRSIKDVEENGMYIGRYRGQYIIERVDRTFEDG